MLHPQSHLVAMLYSQFAGAVSLREIEAGLSSHAKRLHPMLREVRARIPTGKIPRIMTNDLKAPAQEIAELYKRRWAIELFFRWVTQTLKIKRFLGVSENAVRIQIAIVLIALGGNRASSA